MKRLHLYKIYTPRDIAKILLRKEEEIIALLEEKKTIGRKMFNFWYVRGKEILEIQKLLKGTEKNVGTTHNGLAQKKEKEKETKKRSKKTQ